MTEKVDILIRARDAFGRVLGKAHKQLGDIKVSAAQVRLAFVAVAASLVGVTVALTKMFKVGANALETQSKFNTVFGESAAKLDEFADSFGKLAGLTRSQAQSQLATTGAIVQGMGLSTEASAEFAKQVVTLAGDLQSFNDIPIEETARAIQGAITGEREMLKRLGIVINEVDVKQRGLANRTSASSAALTQQEKVTATLQLVMERAGKAVGDLPRTASSAANMARQVGREFRQIFENLSVDLVPALASILPILDAIATKLGPIAEGIGDMALGITDKLGLTSPGQRIGAGSQEPLTAQRANVEAAIARRQAELEGLPAAKDVSLMRGSSADISGALRRTVLEEEISNFEEALERIKESIKKLAREVSVPTALGPIDVGAPRGVRGIGGGPISARGVGTVGFGSAADRRRLELNDELEEAQDRLTGVAETSTDMSVTVADNMFNMARAGIEGSKAMEQQMVSSISSILQAAAGGGVVGSIIGGVAGLIGGLFGGGKGRPTPVHVASYSSEALNQRRESQELQGITVQVVSPLDNSVLSEVEYELNRRSGLDAVPRIPRGGSIGR